MGVNDHVKTTDSRYLERVAQQRAAVRAGLPGIGGFILDSGDDFRGLVIMVSDRGGFLAIAKRFGGDGTPEVCFGNGATPYDALLSVGEAVARGLFRTDTRAL